MDEFDTKDIQSVVFIEPKTNNVVIKIIGFENEETSKMYASWVMINLGFDYYPFGEPILDTIH